MKIKLNNLLVFKVIIISLFVFNYAIREKFCFILKDVNVLFFIAMTVFLYINRKNISVKKMIFIAILFFYNLIINIITGSRINNIVYFNIQTIIPLLIFSVDISKKKIMLKEDIQKIVNFYNLFIFVFFLIFILDLISNNAFSRILSDLLTVNSSNWIAPSVLNNRYHFFFAHPLYCSLLVMIYYLINVICQKNKIKTNIKYWTFHIIAAALLFAFGSKTAIILFLLIFYLYNYTPRRLAIGIFLMVMLYFSGNMNFLLKRFIEEGASTSGRNESILEALKYGLIKIRMFTGKGENIQFILINVLGLNAAGAVQEYPLLVLLFRYGVFYTFLLSDMLFFKPLKEFFKSKNISLIIGSIVLILQLNMFNGLTALVEVEIVYIMFILIMRYINLYLEHIKIYKKCIKRRRR